MQIDRERLWQHLRFLCESIGPRLSGTPADERAVAYIAAHFRGCGAEVEIQDFPCPGWEHESTVLELLGNGPPVPLPAVAQTFTEGCDVQAELAVVGTRRELEFRPDLEGRVLALVGPAAGGLTLDRNPGLLALEERRPAAVLVVCSGETVPTKLLRDPFLRVPAAAVPAAAGSALLQHVGPRRAVRLRIRARRYASTGHNVIGRLPGFGPGRIVVGAHYDTAAGCMGATDDASGTAALLELCHSFAAARRVRRGPALDLIAFGAEEYGRHLRALGSVEYVRRHPAHARATVAAVQLDGVGTVAAEPRAHLLGWSAAARRGLLDVFARFAPYRVDEQEVLSSDHAAFFLNGVPAVALMDLCPAVPIHTPADTLEYMDPDRLALATETARAVVEHLAAGAGWW